jgi:hypothetical protein
VRTCVLIASAIVGSLLLSRNPIQAQASLAEHALEDIHVVRSLRLSRVEPSEFCSRSRTTFADAVYEERYSFAAVTTAPHTGVITDALGAQAGSAHVCFGSTSDPDDSQIGFPGNGASRRALLSQSERARRSLRRWAAHLEHNWFAEVTRCGV